jgi:hypothetical protein
MKRLLCLTLAALLAAGGVGIAAASAAEVTTVGIATSPSGGGHWLVDAQGHVTTDGDATPYGSLGGAPNQPIVGIAATRSGHGYWLVARDGGIFSFGDAAFHGSTGAIHLNQPIVGIASTTSGNGYWMVASDGGIFSFGDAAFFGSTGAIRLNQPIVGMAPTTSGNGYWLVARDGGIFAFGDAAFFGSTGAIRLNQPIVGMAAAPSGAGYWLAAADGGIFSFGDAPFAGTGSSRTTAVAGGSGYSLASADGRVQAYRLTGGTAPAPAPAASPAPAPAPAGRVAALWPFSSSSPWNMPIGSRASFESATATRTANLLDPSISTWVNIDQYSHPIYQASVLDPLAVFTRAGYANVSIRVPANATPAAGTDRHLHVIDPTGHYVDENWHVGGTFPNLTTGYHVRTDLYGPGVGEGGVRAYGGSAIGGLIRTWELQQGSIRHALAIAITNSQLERGPVWPATLEDGDAGSTYAGQVPMGTLAAIPSSVNVAGLGLSPTGLALARALQNYGAYVVDRTYGCVCFFAEPSAAGTQAARDLRTDAAKLRPYLRVVANNGLFSVGGGGSPIAELAPSL